MLFDTHTNLMWYPDHLSGEFVQFAWEAKRAKMKLSPDVYFAGTEMQQANAFDSRPEQLLQATAEADKVRCGTRHFEALGVSFAVVVTADDV